ncbi:4202_t:CDS:1, partial [Racocetra persica]
DSDEELPLSSQAVHTNLVEITNRVLNDQNKYNSLIKINSNVDESIEKQNPSTSSFNCVSNIQNYEQDVKFFDYQSNISDESIEEQSVELFDHSDIDSQSNTSDEQSDLSDITDIDINEYIEYDALYTRRQNDPEDIYQVFLSEEYAEFMHIVTKFHIQDILANAFIRFFNKYSNRNDYPLPSISQRGQEFIEDLNLPNFG